MCEQEHLIIPNTQKIKKSVSLNIITSYQGLPPTLIIISEKHLQYSQNKINISSHQYCLQTTFSNIAIIIYNI